MKAVTAMMMEQLIVIQKVNVDAITSIAAVSVMNVHPILLVKTVSNA